jgi:uncharacterized protein (DUF924 family)
MDINATDIIDFWFVAHTKDDWYGGKPEFDEKIATRFTKPHSAAARGELSGWRRTAAGRLAEILVLDQFSRQLFRGRGEAFAHDPMALTLAQEAIVRPEVLALEKDWRGFVLMPFMHSESLVVHDQALPLFEAYEDADMLDFERRHRDLIVRFGRYPKRNAALGRISTPDEIAYIEGSGDGFF